MLLFGYEIWTDKDFVIQGEGRRIERRRLVCETGKSSFQPPKEILGNKSEIWVRVQLICHLGTKIYPTVTLLPIFNTPSDSFYTSSLLFYKINV